MIQNVVFRPAAWRIWSPQPRGTNHMLRASARIWSQRYWQPSVARKEIRNCFASFIAMGTFDARSPTVFRTESSFQSSTTLSTFTRFYTVLATIVDGASACSDGCVSRKAELQPTRLPLQHLKLVYRPRLLAPTLVTGHSSHSFECFCPL